MEARAAISRNLSALKRIAFEFFAMAGFDGMNPPEPIARGESTMPRRLYNAVMALLRPAEAATRRLIIAMARDIQVKPPKPRPRPQRRRFIARPRTADGAWLASTPQQAASLPIHSRFQLLDPRKRSFRPGRPMHGPRIRSFDEPPKPIAPTPPPAPPRPKPRPDDPIDAAKLVGRLVALCDALDDMPKQAERFARWRARRAAGQTRRFTPLRGLPLQTTGTASERLPGGRMVVFKPGAKRPKRIREIDEVLDNANYLAWRAMRPDTS